MLSFRCAGNTRGQDFNSLVIPDKPTPMGNHVERFISLSRRLRRNKETISNSSYMNSLVQFLKQLNHRRNYCTLRKRPRIIVYVRSSIPLT